MAISPMPWEQGYHKVGPYAYVCKYSIIINVCGERNVLNSANVHRVAFCDQIIK